MGALWLLAAFALLASRSSAQEFTVSNGQIFTPGFAVLNAPQPETPLGGETLHISLDVTANGQLPLPPDLADDSSSRIFNITIFLYSYETGRNFTVSNGTATEGDASLGDIMSQEDGSTVKHINWVWPDCLVGDGPPEDGEESDRGAYNISIRQNFRLNDEDHYTVFDVPIQVTNSIESSDNRPACDVLVNTLLSPEEIDVEAANGVGVLFAPDDATDVDFETVDEEGDGQNNDQDDGSDGDTDDNQGGGNQGGDNQGGDNQGGDNQGGDNQGGDNQGGDNTQDGNGEGDGSDGTTEENNDNDSNGGDSGESFGGQRPEAGPEDGLGSDAPASRKLTISSYVLAVAAVFAAL